MAMTQERLDERKSSLGGSDAAAALGLSKYKTPFRLWQEKTGAVEPDDLSSVEAVEMGILLEPIVATLFERRNPGKRLHNVNRMLTHPEYPWMTTNLDRRVVGEKACAEIKTAGQWAASSDEWGEPGTDEIPASYLVQVQHQLAITGYEVGYVPVLIGGQKYAQYVVQRDDAFISQIIEGERAFWACVQSGTPPDVRSVDEAKERFPISVARTITANESVRTWLAEFSRLDAEAKSAEKSADEFKAMVLGAMGEADTLVDGDGDRVLATWKSSAAVKYFDKETLSSDHPEIIEAYTSERPGSRRFLPKRAK